MAGLRERKKEQTRDAIVAAALDLFDKRGYEHTTIADIAAAADIAPRTFFGYFPAKEDVLFAGFDDDRDSLQNAITDRPSGQTTLQALRAWVVDMVEHSGEKDPKFEHRRRCAIDDNEQLAARERELLGRFEDTLADAFAVDLDAGPDDVRPRLAAAGAVAALRSLKPPGEPAGEHPEDPLALLDQALDFVQGGIDALK